MIDFDKAERALNIFYGGDAGAKDAIVFDNEVWMIKFPKTTRNLTNPQISYTTSPLSEYLGSKIYETLDIPVHETLLGTRKNKVVVACKDFTHKPYVWEVDVQSMHQISKLNGIWRTKPLIHFRNLKNSFMSSDLESYSGTGSETLLDEVLDTINGQSELKFIPGVLERFWDMFVVDAFIGTNDRNNDNWGLLLNPDSGEMDLAPVYDNGNAFFNKRSLAQMEKRIDDDEAMKEDAYKTVRCAYKYTGLDNEGHKINPFDFIKRGENDDCNEALSRFIKTVDMGAIEKLIGDIPEAVGTLAVMPRIQKEFYLKLMSIRHKFLSNLT